LLLFASTAAGSLFIQQRSSEGKLARKLARNPKNGQEENGGMSQIVEALPGLLLKFEDVIESVEIEKS